MGEFRSAKMKVDVLHLGELLMIKCGTSETTERLQEMIEDRGGMRLTEGMRLICDGKQLVPGQTFTEQNIKSNATITLLTQPKEPVCQEWLAAGRCSLINCHLRHTHTFEYSPRYLAHAIKSKLQHTSRHISRSNSPELSTAPPTPPVSSQITPPAVPTELSICSSPFSPSGLSPSATPFSPTTASKPQSVAAPPPTPAPQTPSIQQAAVSDGSHTIPWDCTKDPELPTQQPGSLAPVCPPTVCSSPWGRRGLKRGVDWGSPPSICRGKSVHWADTVKLWEVTSVREFHSAPEDCFDTDDLEKIFERCGM